MKILIVSLILLFFLGCDSQSPNVRYVNNLNVHLYHNPDETDLAKRLDNWTIYEKNIYSASFGFCVELTADYGDSEIPVSGVTIECHVEHLDPTGSGHDIWNELAGSDRYGFVNPLPEAFSEWDRVKGIAKTKTCERGIAQFHIGLGEKDGTSHPDYLWPDEIRTLCKLKFIIPRNSADPIIKEAYCYFRRQEGLGFKEGANSPYYRSFSGIGEAPEGNTNGICNNIKIPERPNPPDYYINLYDGNDSIISDSGNDWWYEQGTWKQLIWDSNIEEWEWQDPCWIIALPSPDMNEPWDMAEMLTLSNPYSFLCIAGLENAVNLESRKHSIILLSKDQNGQVISSVPVKIEAYEINGHQVKMITDYVIAIDSFIGQGRHQDLWGLFYGADWWYSVIHVKENGYLELYIDSFFGDFDLDGIVNNKDMAGFGKHWNKSAWTQSEGESGSSSELLFYDLKYDFNHDGYTNYFDLEVLSENWLQQRPPFALFGDFNLDGAVNFLDFAIFANNYNYIKLKNLQENWLK